MDTHEKIPKFILFATGAQPKKVTSRSEFFFCVCVCVKRWGLQESSETSVG